MVTRKNLCLMERNLAASSEESGVKYNVADHGTCNIKRDSQVVELLLRLMRVVFGDGGAGFMRLSGVKPK